MLYKTGVRCVPIDAARGAKVKSPESVFRKSSDIVADCPEVEFHFLDHRLCRTWIIDLKQSFDRRTDPKPAFSIDQKVRNVSAGRIAIFFCELLEFRAVESHHSALVKADPQIAECIFCKRRRRSCVGKAVCRRKKCELIFALFQPCKPKIFRSCASRRNP